MEQFNSLLSKQGRESKQTGDRQARRDEGSGTEGCSGYQGRDEGSGTEGCSGYQGRDDEDRAGTSRVEAKEAIREIVLESFSWC